MPAKRDNNRFGHRSTEFLLHQVGIPSKARDLPKTHSQRRWTGEWIFLVLIFILPFSSQSQSFTDVTESSGINHQFRVYEGMFGGGACVFDYNNDGFEDLYLTSGMNEDVLYKNNGNGTFTNVFEGSGLERTRSFVT
ncbi:MAG: VCBS repeat-containing protein, partial [Bacteroidetes bacterium]|nr:VCBS repeat-containing protein [Bacteroidota bacterium]